MVGTELVFWFSFLNALVCSSGSLGSFLHLKRKIKRPTLSKQCLSPNSRTINRKFPFPLVLIALWHALSVSAISVARLIPKERGIVGRHP